MKIITTKIALTIALTGFTMMEVEALGSKNVQNFKVSESKIISNDLRLALQLGLSQTQYKRFIEVKSLSGAFYNLPNAINLEASAAWMQVKQLEKQLDELPINLQDEVQNITQHNIQVAAEYVGVTASQFNELLSKYVSLTGTTFKATRTIHSNSASATSTNEDDEQEEEEVQVEVISVTYTVSGSNALSLLNHGHAGLMNRIQRDASNTITSQLGVVNVTFNVPEKGMVVQKQYQYDSGSISNNGDFSCTGNCNDGNIFIPF
ncbi:hypothetical protein KJ365_04280 [Glaciecola sp. XM2]|jgi:hypothetical protein|uniref:hypothetical protein n=1 Tax=Glaciecola sp. XM2 TaxID=1914931 RepID=UPI001BDE1A39|nr:hypothetical protein [Glaciecola sp. XM2]MBT1450086.1 hypothetical protein [Glaciecola sp. XM2]